MHTNFVSGFRNERYQLRLSTMALRFTSNIVSCTLCTRSSVIWSKPNWRAPFSNITSSLREWNTLLCMNSSTDSKKYFSDICIISPFSMMAGPIPMNFTTPRLRAKSPTSLYSAVGSMPLWNISLRIRVRRRPLWSGRRFMKSRAISRELISEL